MRKVKVRKKPSISVVNDRPAGVGLSIPPMLLGAGVVATLIVLFVSSLTPAEPPLETVTVAMSDAIIETRYRFSDPDARMLDFIVDRDNSVIFMITDVPKDAELEIHFNAHLLDSPQGTASPAGYPIGDDFDVLVDGKPADVAWSYAGLEATANIPVQGGAESIEIVSKQ
jgi:hypothetical protein